MTSFELLLSGCAVEEPYSEQFEVRSFHKCRRPWTDLRRTIALNSKFPNPDQLLYWLRQQNADACIRADYTVMEEHGPGEGLLALTIVFRDPIAATLYRLRWT